MRRAEANRSPHDRRKPSPTRAHPAPSSVGTASPPLILGVITCVRPRRPENGTTGQRKPRFFRTASVLAGQKRASCAGPFPPHGRRRGRSARSDVAPRGASASGRGPGLACPVVPWKPVGPAMNSRSRSLTPRRLPRFAARRHHRLLSRFPDRSSTRHGPGYASRVAACPSQLGSR